MAETKSFTEMIETDRHTWRECLGCGTIIEEKVFSKVVSPIEEVQLIKFPNSIGYIPKQGEGYYLWDDTKKDHIKATKKQVEQTTRKYKVGDEYQWFGYGTGGKHTCSGKDKI